MSNDLPSSTPRAASAGRAGQPRSVGLGGPGDVAGRAGKPQAVECEHLDRQLGQTRPDPQPVVGSRLPAAPARGATVHRAPPAVALVWPGQRSSAASPGRGDRGAWPPGPHWPPSGSRLGGRLLGRRLPPGLSRIGRRGGRLHQPLGEIPLGGQQLLGEPKHVVDDPARRWAPRGSWSMRGHPTSAAHSRTMRGPRWPTPPGPRGPHPDIAPEGRSRTIRWCSSDAPRSGSSGRDSRPARCLTGGPRGRAQHQAPVPEQAAALRRRRARRTLAATLARSSVACVLWAGVVSMTPPGRVAAAPAPLAVAPLDRHSPARRHARTALGPAWYSGLAQGSDVLSYVRFIRG